MPPSKHSLTAPANSPKSSPEFHVPSLATSPAADRRVVRYRSLGAGKQIPQVLFLGDPVQQAIVQAAAKELTGKANFHYPPLGSANDSGTALARIDDLLGDKPWDIIYFNFGIGDLFYKDPATKEIRIMNKDAGGVRVTTPAQYEKNLDAIVKRLTASKAKLIWGSTTPLNNGKLFDGDSEKEYNAIAARVMAKHKAPVLDLHAHAMAKLKPGEKQPPPEKYAAEMQKRGHPLHPRWSTRFSQPQKLPHNC